MEIGQKIYFRCIGNAHRRYGDKILEATVSKVGRKYFEVDSDHAQLTRERFFIHSLCHDGGEYIPNYHGYFSIKEIEEEDEALNILHKAYRFFKDIYPGKLDGFTLEELRTIKKIIDDVERRSSKV